MLGKQTKSALAIPVPSDKEPAGRRASGLAHLMTALHQNAAAVVNSKTQLNGPDQVRVLRSGYSRHDCKCFFNPSVFLSIISIVSSYS